MWYIEFNKNKYDCVLKNRKHAERQRWKMKYIEFDSSRPLDLILLGRVAIDFNPAYNDQIGRASCRERV